MTDSMAIPHKDLQDQISKLETRVALLEYKESQTWLDLDLSNEPELHIETLPRQELLNEVAKLKARISILEDKVEHILNSHMPNA